MKIYAPVKDFNGLRNNVYFVNGVGETDDKWAIEWFIRRGYTVEKSLEKCEEVNEKSHEKCDEPDFTDHFADIDKMVDEPDFDSMTPNDLRDWMREHGYGSKIKNTRNKEKLLEILRG